MSSLVDVLREAERLGLDRKHRHEVAIRYRDAFAEYLRYTVRPLNGSPERLIDYELARDTHAASKALGYIERHVGVRS